MDEQFWADHEAIEVVKIRGEKDSFVCESGVTPSGPKHIGTFREVITVDLIVKALRDLGKNVKFQYVWDSYDRFRKVPAEVPKSKVGLMKNELGKPVCDVLDPWGCHDSWAAHWMSIFEQEVRDTGIKPTYIRQHELYKKGFYAKSIKQALNRKDKIINALNMYRKEPLTSDWWPIMVYCEKCKKDMTKIESYDGEYGLSYKCKCGHADTIDFRKKGLVKLRWRVDWPMRWAFYGVDFEPAGKDHMVEGSSITTGRLIVKDVFKSEPPYSFMYGFVRSKGGSGKMSASKGNVVFVNDALKVYLTPVLRFIFAGNRVNTDFPLPFDEDVLKIYEDFYQCERAYYGLAIDLSEKRAAHLKRVYEFCMPKPRKRLPAQLSFRTAALIAQTIPEGEWFERASEVVKTVKADESRVLELIKAAQHWVDEYAPDNYKIVVNKRAPQVKLPVDVKAVLKELGSKLLSKSYSEEELGKFIFELARRVGVKDFFKGAYQVIISRDKGPRLAQFIKTVGQDRIGKLLSGL